MSDILTKIANYTKVRIDVLKQNIPLDIIKSAALDKNLNTGFPFKKSLQSSDLTFICECKKASPSKGIIANDFPYLDIAKDYERAGADCISVLTEPNWFMGSEKYLQEISSSVSIPTLRKDFVIDEYMIYQGKALGASAILLICSLLDNKQLEDYICLCHSLGMSPLVEVHNSEEINRALNSGAEIIGINNRNLKDFTVDIQNTSNLMEQIPKNLLVVGESGIKTPHDVMNLEKSGVNGVLIGETLMKAKDRQQCLFQLRGKHIAQPLEGEK